MTDLVLLNVTVEVETRDGRRGRGLGSMPMGNVWAWPSRLVSGDQTLAAMIDLGQRLASEANHFSGSGHPLEITHDLSSSYETLADEVTQAAGLAERMPRLAQLVAASPLEAAIHDAYGKALGQNSYNLLGPEFVSRDLAAYLNADFAGEYLDRYTLRQPKPQMPLYHLDRRLGPLDRCRRVHANPRRPAGDAVPMDCLQRSNALEDQTGGRRFAVGRRSHVVGRARGGGSPGRARLHDLALFGRFQRKVRQRRVCARFPGKGWPAVASGIRAAPIHRAADAAAIYGPIPKIACTGRPKSSRW